MLRQQDMNGLIPNSFGFAYGGAAVFSTRRSMPRTYLTLTSTAGAKSFVSTASASIVRREAPCSAASSLLDERPVRRPR